MKEEKIAIICPDIHGRDFWVKAANDYDGSIPFIFLGDYLDPYKDEGISDNDAKNNFLEIWKFKQKWGNKVILLLGNHDLSYYDDDFRCCRFSFENYGWYKDFLKQNWKDFSFFYEIETEDKKFLFSHAGVHPLWIANNHFEDKLDSDYLNSLFNENKKAFNDISFYRGGGLVYGSPIWSDIRDYMGVEMGDDNLIQFIGHTQLVKDFMKVNDVYCIDSRQTFVLTTNINKIKDDISCDVNCIHIKDGVSLQKFMSTTPT